MPVNKEELLADLANPEYQNLVKTELTKKEFTVLDKAEHQSYLERVKKDTIERELPAKLKETHDLYDKDVKETFGIERDTNEKSYDYLKRAGKAKIEEINAAKAKIVELEEAVKKGDPTGVWAKKLQETEAKAQALIAEKDRELTAIRQQSSTLTKKAQIDLAFADIKKDFRKQLPPLFDVAQDSVLSSALNSTAVAEDGKLYMVDAQGAWVKDSSFNRMPLEQFLRDKFKDVIEIKKTQGGTGGGTVPPDPNLDPSKLTVENFPMKPSIKTGTELMDYMLELGLKRGTKEFSQIWGKFRAALKE